MYFDALQKRNESKKEHVQVDCPINTNDKPKVVNLLELDIEMAFFVSIHLLFVLYHLIYLFSNILRNFHKEYYLKDLG